MQYKLGMVLSGGGARGLVHAGVLQAMAEQGIEPQVLAGSSAGAIVAALHGGGYSGEEILEFFVEKNPLRLSKLSLVKPGIFDTDKAVGDFLEYFPENTFEALKKRIFLAATDIVEAKPEIFGSGPLIPAILASASTPLLFTPTEIDGHWYSDGGIVNNFPVEPLLGHCDLIFGVYATPLRRIVEPDLRNSLSVSQRAFEIGMYYSSKRKFHQCDLLLCPTELSRFGTFDTKHFQEIMQIGYRAAQEQMETILRLLGRGEGGPDDTQAESQLPS